MVEVVLGAAGGLVAGWLVWTGTWPWFAHPGLARPNYRDAVIPGSAGVVMPLALVAVEAGRAVAVAATGAGDAPANETGRLLTVLVAGGFCLLGLLDDVAGSGEHRGFRGHLRALASGRVTTGLCKLAGGAAVAVIAVRPLAGDSVARLVADAALVALAANLANLLDRAPGRAGKAGLAAFVVLVAATGADPVLAGVAVIAGAAAALLVDDLRERLMLGDAGANPLGAVLGLGVVLATAPATRNAVLAALVALNLLGEVVSFSRVIAAVPPLRSLDRAGRPAATGAG